METERAVAACRQAADESAAAVRDSAIARLDMGDEIGKERGLRRFVMPVDPPAPAAGHDNDRGRNRTLLDQAINRCAQLAFYRPVVFVPT